MPTELGLLTAHVVDVGGLNLPSRVGDVYAVLVHDDVEYRTPLARRRDGRLTWEAGVTLNLAEGSPAVARLELRSPGLVRATLVGAGDVSVERAVSSGFDGVAVALTSKSGACRGHVRMELCFMLGENTRGDAFESGALVNGPTDGDDPESATSSVASEPAHAPATPAPASPSSSGPLGQGASRLPGGPGGPAVPLPSYGLHGPSRLGRTASIQLPPPLAAALAASSSAAEAAAAADAGADADPAPPPPPGAPFSLAHARSATEAVLARTFSVHGAGAALLGAARRDLPAGGLARGMSDAAALAAAAAAAAEYEAGGDADWDLAALTAPAAETAGDDGRSVRRAERRRAVALAGLAVAAPPAPCCSYAARHGASVVGDCGCCKGGGGGGGGGSTVALTAAAGDAASAATARPPPPQGPLAALEDIHDIVRGYVDACAEFELRPAAAAFAPPRDGGAAAARARRRRRRSRADGGEYGPPDTPASDGALSIDSDGGAWGSPTARSPSASLDSELGAGTAAPPHSSAFASLALADKASADGGLPRVRTARRGRGRGGRRATLDGGESTDDAAVSVSPAW